MTSSSGFQLEDPGGAGKRQRRQCTGSLSPGVASLPCSHPDRCRAGTRVRIAGVDKGREVRGGVQSSGRSQAAGPGRSSGTRGRAPLPHPSPAGARRAGAASRETHSPRPGDQEALPARSQATLSGAGRGRARAPRGLTFSDVSLFSASAFGPEWPALRREKTH